MYAIVCKGVYEYNTPEKIIVCKGGQRMQNLLYVVCKDIQGYTGIHRTHPITEGSQVSEAFHSCAN